MPHYTVEQRNAAVAAHSQAFRNVPKAADILQREDPTFKGHSRKSIKKFIRRQVDKHERLHNVADQYKNRAPPNPKKVPDDEALRCAAILKAGYIATKTLTFGRRKGGKRREEVRVWREYYSGIREACLKEPYLYEVCNMRGVTPAHLLRRMHEVDPNLVMRRRDMKRALSPEQRAERMAAAKRNLEQLEAEGPAYVRHITWVDEFAIWMVAKKGCRQVYCDAHDEGVHVVVPLETVQKGDKVKLRILLAVNWRLGACFMEFMTGTSDIQRLHLQVKTPYKVSGSSHVQPCALSCTWQQPLTAAVDLSLWQVRSGVLGSR